VRAILHDEKRILPVSPLLEGEYGVFGVHASVPAVIGKDGVEEIVQLKLSEKELKEFHNSCEVIKRHIDLVSELIRGGN
jgi:L-lactate dehydrogenase